MPSSIKRNENLSTTNNQIKQTNNIEQQDNNNKSTNEKNNENDGKRIEEGNGDSNIDSKKASKKVFIVGDSIAKHVKS